MSNVNLLNCSPPDVLRVCHLNAQSINSKYEKLQHFFRKQKYHIIGISETWLKSHHTNKSVKISGYKLFRQDRKGRNGGGVAFYIRKNFLKSSKPRIVNKDSSAILDHLVLEISLQSTKIAIGVGYMHHKGLPLDELETVLSNCREDYENIIFMGDFNIDLLIDNESRNLRNILTHFNLSTPQTQPTRYNDSGGGSLIDLIISDVRFTLSDFTQLPGISDHEFTGARFNFPTSCQAESVTYRNYEILDIVSLHNDIDNLDWSELLDSNDINLKVTILNDKLTQLLNRHAPFITRKIIPNKPPWLTKKIDSIMQLRNMAYAAWKRTRSSDDKEILKIYERRVKGMLKGARKNYCRKKLDPNLGSKQLWKHIKEEGLCAKADNDFQHLFNVNELNEAFVAMGSRDSVSSHNANMIPNSNATSANILQNDRPQPTIPQTFSFTEIEEDQVFIAIMKIKSGSLGSDGIPLKFIKLCTPAILPMITHIFNFVIQTDAYPNEWKIGRVIAIPKIPEPKTISDMRPITLLSSLSKALEILLADQIKYFLNTNKLLSDFQSGFRESHSTTSLLFDVTDFIRQCMDRGNYAVLVLLDFSKAFNSINFDIFKNKLIKDYNFSSNAIQLLISYLTNRIQYVQNMGINSSFLPLLSGVPQGSILGPIIFSMYINSVTSSIVHCKFHLFADDLQILHEIKYNVNLSKSIHINTIELINEDIMNINNWANNNSLELNAAKSKAIVFGRNSLHELLPAIKLNDNIIPYVTTIKNLGILMNYDLDWTPQIDQICQKMFYTLRLLKSKKFGIPIKTRILLVKSLVLSNLTYCDIIFSDLKSILMTKVTRVFNSCLRFIYDLRRYDHISPVSNIIYGLPLKLFLESRLTLFLFKLIRDPNSPSYLKKRLNFSRSTRTKVLMIETHKSSIMKESLLVRGALAWNRLPLQIRQSSTVGQFKRDSMRFYASS